MKRLVVSLTLFAATLWAGPALAQGPFGSLGAVPRYTGYRAPLFGAQPRYSYNYSYMYGPGYSFGQYDVTPVAPAWSTRGYAAPASGWWFRWNW